MVLTWLLILGKIQDGSQDGDHCWWCHRPLAVPPPIKYTSSCWVNQKLSNERKIISKYCNISASPGRGSINPPPRLLYQGEGMNLRVCPKVNILLFICLWQWKKASIHYAINPNGSWPSFMGTSPPWFWWLASLWGNGTTQLLFASYYQNPDRSHKYFVPFLMKCLH